MRVLRTVTTVLGLALMSAVFSPGAKADEWNRKTVLTFSGPVEIPGVHLQGFGVLPAGTYVFKIMDSQSDRHIVQIFNQDETRILATILAITNYRLKVTDKSVITFRERPAGEPEALRAWFYPGENFGEEFVYPRAKAIELAKETHTAVLFTPAEVPVEVAEPIATVDHPVVVQLKQAPVMAIQPTGEEVAVATVVAPAPAVEVASEPAPAPVAVVEPTAVAVAELPQTSSRLPLIALLGLLALGAGLALRRV